ncbi:hypothetical protein NFHSH190041_09100 [Shewanella sp. NFH-SH190041]|uniref:ABC transporter substrate-binding protein n=1 Tax=Shewanella sp. NFH-SH190041 TaxID=2950245 RepID=UPI0021C4B83F|nr:ABC transporter substrate-binding protein [Shewanella sp. NFH-SH190041]BDM63458.1 hypothetical protein NFHSH190041_09100 [Shewanella sp. NFH-SH190041]
MSNIKTFSAAVFLFIGLLSHSAMASQQVTDQLGRSVILPDHISRVAVLQHQTLNILNQLNALNDVVAIQSSWKKSLGAHYVRLAPQLASLPMPGDLTQVNIESLLATQPQVVFVANYAPQEMIEQIEKEGVPVIAISLRQAPTSEKSKLNPTLRDDKSAYDNGLKEGIRLIAQIVNKKAEGEELIKATFANQHLIQQRLANIPAQERVRVYLANPDLYTYGKGKYTGVMMERSGAYNVAAADLKGYQSVSIEQILAWDPKTIFVQNRFPKVVSTIKADPNWQWISAVKNQNIYLMPEYAKAWGYPMPEAIALGELWMAKTLYPAQFEDIDLDKKVHDYYQHFYRVAYQENKLND